MTTERLLFIEEDAQDYLKIRRVLDERSVKFSTDWAPNYDSAFKLIRKNNYHVCLIGYYPKHIEQQKFLVQLYPFITIPTILLTKLGETVNHDWLDKIDFLNKEQLDLPQLERAIRYLSQLLSLQQAEQKFHAIVENACEFIGLMDPQGTIIEINQTALTFWGAKREEMIGKPIWETLWVLVSAKYPAKLKIAIARCAKGEWLHYDLEVQGEAGQVIALNCSLKPMRIHGNQVLLLEGRDAKARKSLAEKRINDHDLLDYLTGLPNRQSFMEHLERAMNQVQRRKNYHIALLFIDLDRFRVINASLGHDMGDWLLMEIAHRLRSCLKKEAILARSGGDEFLILLDDLQDLNEAIRLAKTINETVAQPFSLDGYEIITSASIGIAYSTHQEVAHIDLLRDVDTAMYKAKTMGKSCYAVFQREMHTQAVSRLKIEMDLHQAMEKNNFVLFYQPQMDLAAGELVGAEALIRLCHPQNGLMSPIDFIPVLEDTGIIITLGEWILKTACTQLKAWLNAGLVLGHVAVNLSAHQFRYKRLNDFVDECLALTGLAPECLELEITETLLLEDTDSAVKMLKQFKNRGIRVTIDDFGTGYASLNYLKRFPADALKIDKSFIQGITSAPKDAAIIVATIDMAHALGLIVVAEGVETVEQRDFLCDHGCDWAQGYFYSAPVEEAAFSQWAAQYNRMLKTKN